MYCKFSNNNKNFCNKSLIEKNNNKYEKVVFLAKTILNTKEVLISKTLIDSNISHDEFVAVNKFLKEYDDIKKELQNSNDK